MTVDSPRTTGAFALGGGTKFRFGPILAATVITFLLLWLFKTVAHVFVLLMLSVLVSLYLGAVADYLDRRTRLSKRTALAIAIVGSLAALVFVRYRTPPGWGTTWRLRLRRRLPRWMRWKRGPNGPE